MIYDRYYHWEALATKNLDWSVPNLWLYSGTLAPSASQTMDETTLLCIAGSLLNKPIQFESDRIKLLASLGKPSLESFSIPEVYTESLLVFYKEQEETAVGLRRKEVSGIPVLGAFLACVVKLLNGQKQEHSVARYRYELEFTVMKASGTPGKNPATDGAVFVAVHVSSICCIVAVSWKNALLSHTWSP